MHVTVCSLHAFQHLLGPGPGPSAAGTLGTCQTQLPPREQPGATGSPEGDILPNLRNIRGGFLVVSWLGLDWGRVLKNKEKLAQWKRRAGTQGPEPGHCTESRKVKGSSAVG